MSGHTDTDTGPGGTHKTGTARPGQPAPRPHPTRRGDATTAIAGSVPAMPGQKQVPAAARRAGPAGRQGPRRPCRPLETREKDMLRAWNSDCDVVT